MFLLYYILNFLSEEERKEKLEIEVILLICFAQGVEKGCLYKLYRILLFLLEESITAVWL